MPDNKKPVPRRSIQGEPAPTRLLWYGVGAAVVVFVIVAVFVAIRSAVPFEMAGGETSHVVFLRNESTAFYEITYTGRRPAELERIIPRIQLYQDQLLVADVQAVVIRIEGEVIPLEDGYFPEGGSLALEPDQVFEVGVTYLGQELGWNRIYGWRLLYTLEGRLVDSELELRDDYYIIVE